MIVPRLILGTARIAGGADERRAIAIVRCALDMGVSAIDTAPSYGMGTAEAAVGKAISGYPGVEVTTKLGSAPPSLAWLRTLARRARRMIAASDAPAAAISARQLDKPTGNDFSRPAMAASLQRSLDRLGRIDALLLHDVSAEEVTSDVLAAQSALCATVAARPGYAVHAQWSANFDALFAPEAIAQTAPVADWLAGNAMPARRGELRLHSLGKTGLAMANGKPEFGSALAQAADICPAPDRTTARLAALYALAAERLPGARLLVTSSHKSRLHTLLQTLEIIDRTGSAAEIAGFFASQAG